MDKQYSNNLEIVKDIMRLRKTQKQFMKDGKSADDIAIIKAQINELLNLLQAE